MEQLPWQHLALLVPAGVVAGFINVVAGGGSLLTLPLLLFLGLPASTANATNRISLLFQNASACSSFHRAGRLPWRLSARLALVAAPGALLGARMALEVDEVLFRRILAGVMLILIVVLLRAPKANREESEATPPHPIALGVAFFAMGFYAGFLQAGLGFLLIAALTQLGGLDLIRTNAVKVSVVLAVQVIAIAVFSASGAVDWWRGLALACGSMGGAWLGAHWQMRQGVAWVRRFLVVAVFVFAVRLIQQSL